MTIELTDDERRKREIDNGFRQFQFALNVIHDYLRPERSFALRPSLIQELQKIAVDGLEDYPGEWRHSEVHISKSHHNPPPAFLIESKVIDLCEYVNDQWHERTAFYLSSFIMWRLNWIHPFSDGNGRTSRTLSYIILCVKLGYMLPGSPTIPDQITGDRTAYFAALEDADAHFLADEIYNLVAMEEMLKGMLAKQLLGIISQANGSPIE